MKKGRPPAWTLDSDYPGPACMDVRRVDERGRLTIPGRLLDRLDWFQTGQGAECLLALTRPGRARLLPWVPHGEKVIERRRDLLADSNVDTADLLRSVEDRYLRVTIDSQGRLALPPLAIVHLQGTLDMRVAYVIRYPAEFELWSVEFRNNELMSRSEELEDLP